MIRFLLVLMLAQTSMLWAQTIAPPPSKACPSLEDNTDTALYAGDVWRLVMPDSDIPGGPVIMISVSTGSASKLILRTMDGKKFELLRGTHKQSLFEILNQLAVSCQLPVSADIAAKRISVHWETVEISSDKFAALHRSFTATLSQTMEDAQKRYGTVLVHGGRIIFHSPEFHVMYDNDGYEHIETVVQESGRKNDSSQLMVQWIHQLQILADQMFPATK